MFELSREYMSDKTTDSINNSDSSSDNGNNKNKKTKKILPKKTKNQNKREKKIPISPQKEKRNKIQIKKKLKSTPYISKVKPKNPSSESNSLTLARTLGKIASSAIQPKENIIIQNLLNIINNII